MPAPSLIAFTDSPPKATGNALVARYLQDMPHLNMYRAQELPAQAERIADQLARTPEGRRAVTPFYILAFELKATEYKVDAVGIYERGAVNVTRDTAALAELAWRLERRGIKLDLVYCDNENDLTPWGLGLDTLKAVYRSDAAKARMPDRLRRFDIDKLQFMSPEYHEWMIHLGCYAQQIRVEALRKAIFDSRLATPWSTHTTLVNFFVIKTSFRVYDYNGWEIEHQSLIDGRTSCPVAFPSEIGHRYKGRAHHPVWNSFIDALNHARSAAATSSILPVIREPMRARGQAADSVDPGARWLFDQLLGHLVRTGASRFMHFHSHASTADELALAEILRDHDGATPAVNPTLPEIPLDVDEVVTGDLRTTYSDFLAQKPDRWVKPA